MTPIALSKYRALVKENKREADDLVAEHVCGWNWFCETHKEYGEVFQLVDRMSHPFLTRVTGHIVKAYAGKKKIWRLNLPDYHSDLNACAQMRKALEEKERGRLMAEIILEVKKFPKWATKESAAYYGLNASASQQCEAALMAVGAVVEDGV